MSAWLQNGGVYNGCALIEVGNHVSIELTGSATHNVPDSEVAAVAELVMAAPILAKLLARLEPHLDAIICYASTMGEHEPNAIAADVRGWLGHLRDVGAIPVEAENVLADILSGVRP